MELVDLNCWVTDMNDSPSVQRFDDFGEVGQAAGKAINFVDHNRIDLVSLNVFEQTFQSRPIQSSTEHPPSS